MDGRERADFDPPVARRQSAPTSGAPFAWYSPPTVGDVNTAVGLALETVPVAVEQVAEMVVMPVLATVVAAGTEALWALAKKETAPDCVLVVTANIQVVPAWVAWQQENIDTAPGFVVAAVRGIRSTACRGAALHHCQVGDVRYHSGSAGSNSCYSYYPIHPRMCEFVFCRRPFLQRSL